MQQYDPNFNNLNEILMMVFSVVFFFLFFICIVIKTYFNQLSFTSAHS